MLFIKNQALKLFFILTISFFILGSLVSLFFNQIEIIQKINKFHSSLFDYFFQYFTYLGDGMICIFLIFIFFRNKKYRLNFALSSILILVISSFLKMFVFKDSLRPITFFENKLDQIHIISSVLIFSKYSFPSGHTMVAFGMCTILAAYFEKKIYGIFFFIIALLIGYSRLYLFQHFLIDVIFGAIIGCLISSSVLVFNQIQNEQK